MKEAWRIAESKYVNLGEGQDALISIAYDTGKASIGLVNKTDGVMMAFTTTKEELAELAKQINKLLEGTL